MPTPSLQTQLAEAQARIADLEAALGQSDKILGVTFRLSTSLNKLLGCLMTTPNVTPDMIELRLMIATDAKVAINRLRDKLKAYCEANKIQPPFQIRSQRGLGYWLDGADKDRIRQLTSGVTTPVLAAVDGIPTKTIEAA